MDKLAKYKDYKTVLSVNALICSGGKILFLKRADDKKVDPGLYSGIGGKVEPHESFLDALVREIEEETGITEIESIHPYSVTQHPYPPTDSEWVNIYFIVNIANQVKIEPTDDGSFHWIDPKEVEALPMPRDIKSYLKTLADNPKAFIFGFFDHNEDGSHKQEVIKVL